MSLSNTAARLIKASAGSGKTFQLSNHYIRLLLQGVSPKNILATTFTRKAAAEIRSRVLERLIKACQSANATAKLADELRLPTLSREQLLNTTQELVQQLGQLEITTLDAFFIRICSAYADEVGLLPEWQLVTGQEVLYLQRLALRQLFSELKPADMQLLLTTIGSGQYRRAVVISLLVQLNQLHDLFLESNQQAWFCKDEPIRPIDHGELKELSSTLQSLAMPNTTKGEPDKRWVNARSKLLTVLESGLANQILENSWVQSVANGKTTYYSSDMPYELVALLQELLSKLSADIRYNYNNEARVWLLLLENYKQQLSQVKSITNSYTYSDIKQLFSLTLPNASLDQIYYRIDSKIQHVLFDEFQDTSIKEWTGLQPIVAEILAKANIENTFLCVGDSKQAIYGWRGGVAQIFDQITSRWQQVQSEQLTKSYRSSPIIIDLINNVFAALNQATVLAEYSDVVKAWDDEFELHSTDKEDLPGYVQISSYNNELENNTIDIELIEKVRTLVALKPELSIGILLRDNKALARIVRLLRVEFPEFAISDEGGNALRDSAGVGWLFSLLTFIDHPSDTISIYHLQNSPLANMLGLTLDVNSKYLAAKANQLRDLLLNQGLSQFLNNYIGVLKQVLTNAECKRIDQLLQLAYQYPDCKLLRTTDFIKWAELQKVESAEEAKIRVMTIHSAKGLEFDAVFLPDFQFDLLGLPSEWDVYRANPIEPPQLIVRHKKAELRLLVTEFAKANQYQNKMAISEALCVIYVAMTRARQALYILIDHGKIKTNQKNAANFLIQTLNIEISEEGNQVLYEKGDQAWYKCNCSQVLDQLESQVCQPFHIKTASDDQLRTSLVTAASSLSHTQQSSIAKLVQDNYQEIYKSGENIHALLKEIEWIDANMYTEQLEKWQGSVAADVLEKFKKMLSHEHVRQILDKDYYTRQEIVITAVKRELNILTKYKEQIINGAIDRLVLGNYATGAKYVEVIDFKTDYLSQVLSLESNNLLVKYRPQLAAYAEAAATIAQVAVSDVKQTLVFLSAGLVVSCNQHK